MHLLDFLFPKRCVGCRRFGEYLCADCFARISFDVPFQCLVCNKPAMQGITHPICKNQTAIDGSLASIVYSGIVKKLVYHFKYHPYLTDLQFVLTDLFYEGIIQQEQFHRILETESVLVPIPLHSSKLRQRGYNHAFLLAQELARRERLSVVQVLTRVRKTPMQAALDKKERLENVRGAFAVHDPLLEQIAGRQVLLVDDIITSGATILEAGRTLKKAGVEKVWSIALAHGR